MGTTVGNLFSGLVGLVFIVVAGGLVMLFLPVMISGVLGLLFGEDE